MCVRNLEAQYGYDCICQWPTEADSNVYGEGAGKKPLGTAGLKWEAGCKAMEFRNTESNFKGIKIVDLHMYYYILHTRNGSRDLI